ncbi:hypothetical protein [Pontibacter harenae]|uniref:hypothetical protein n=1 Tax=Pontibacter harenae TaxID=2894083 RepID=UPI001E4214C4|nr:hypothetical protein [Pontibacter harenae]MCC9168412.1 hypothetical protein [Pontibacter harenae]
MTGVCGLHPILPFYNAMYLVFTHGTGYPWVRSLDALLLEFKADPGAAIAALALLIYLLYKSVYRPSPLEKVLTAFFKISRSSCASLSSFCSRLISF